MLRLEPEAPSDGAFDSHQPAHPASICILGPPLLRRSLSMLLATLPSVFLVDRPPAAAVIVAGREWQDLARELLTGTGGERPPHVVLVCTSEPDLLEASCLGIDAFVSEEDEPETLIAAVQATIEHESYCSPRMLPDLLGALRSAHSPRRRQTGPVGYQLLSLRELEVARKVAQGLTNDQVARALHVSLPTVKFHLKQIYRKLGIACRSRLAYLLSDIRDDDL